LKQRGNVNYETHRQLPNQSREGVKMVSIRDAARGNI